MQQPYHFQVPYIRKSRLLAIFGFSPIHCGGLKKLQTPRYLIACAVLGANGAKTQQVSAATPGRELG